MRVELNHQKKGLLAFAFLSMKPLAAPRKAAARMLAVHPAVQIRLVAANCAEVPPAVREREASLGLLELSELGGSPDFIVEALRPQPAIFVVRPGHPLLDLSSPRLADILSWPFVFVGRVPRRAQERLVTAREEARRGGHLHPAFPALIHESPTVALTAVRNSDAVAAVTLPIVVAALRAGNLVALRWREPWASVHCGIIRPRHRRATEAEEACIDLIRTADQEAETMALRFLAEAGMSAAIE